jgi:hypothetical protein
MLRKLAGAWPTEAVWNFLKNDSFKLVIPLSGVFAEIKILSIYINKDNLIIEGVRPVSIKADTKGCLLKEQR